jgi:hypothetical protein
MPMGLFFLFGCLLAVVLVVFYVRRKANVVLEELAGTKAALTQIVWDTASLRALLGADVFLPRPSRWSLESSALTLLFREIEQRKPKLVVELGSGLSSVAMALKLRELACGRLVSIDHDAAFAEQSRSWLALNGLDGVAEVRVASLRPGAAGVDRPPWYDTAALADLAEVDLLVVDGPPMPVHDRIRAPALSFFKDRFAADWLLFLDDADRPGERAFLREWETAHPDIAITLLPLGKGAALVRPALPKTVPNDDA